MKNLIRSTTGFASNIIKTYIEEFRSQGDEDIVAIDATCGNGHDTLALLETGCDKVYAFDVQNQAIESTRDLIISKCEDTHVSISSSEEYKITNCGTMYCNGKLESELELINDSHENIKLYCESANVVVFNLGYLPSGDKSITTEASHTLKAIKASLEILKVNGILSVTMYSGHEGGAEEKESVLDFAQKLDSRIFHVAYINMLNQENNPPEILLITKKKDTI